MLTRKYTNVEPHDWFCTAVRYKKYTYYIWYFCMHYLTREMESDPWQSDKDPAWNGETSEERISLFHHRRKVEHADVIVSLKERREKEEKRFYDASDIKGGSCYLGYYRWHNLFFTLASQRVVLRCKVYHTWYSAVYFHVSDPLPSPSFSSSLCWLWD